ncbi:response regulator [Paraflavisolibacter sp. H34]|uniref:response regulator n=1 Tax=Huijunlia imazamoxiresistens TaxID=3127457 RepID=UPI0030195280
MPSRKLSAPRTVRTIFYADDDPDDVLVFREAMAQIDPSLKIHSVSTGDDLCALLRSLRPDLVFVDLDMPVKSGLECLVEIRQNPLFASLPVVIYSSSTRAGNIEAAYHLGADLFFIKPLSYSDLLVSLRGILQLDWRHPDRIKEHRGQLVPFL